MVKAATAFLAGRDVTVLRSSPLERALETAAPVAAQFGLDVQVDERLIEPWNHFEGTTFGSANPNGTAPMLSLSSNQNHFSQNVFVVAW